MFAEFLQYLLSGITVGATYALVALGFSIIYNASHVINFAQGEFLMLGGMSTVFLMGLGFPMPLAIVAAVLITVAAGFLLEKLAVEPARGAGVVPLIIITIGASMFLRGLVQVVWGKEIHPMPSFSGDAPLDFFGASILPQSIWVLVITVIMVICLGYFFNRTLLGKAILATAHNRTAAQLVGININFILLISFGLSAMLGAVAGIIIAPITLTAYDVGIMLGLKGFVAAVLGGLGNFYGAIVGGVILGITEMMAAGYISSEYKDAMPFILILFILFFMPNGLFGARSTERV